jgi:murein L,D-transpeptidase YcbB/YkuD
MCDPITMITGGTALLSAAMGAAQQAIGVTQQLQRAAEQRNDFNFLAAQQRNAAAFDEMQARQAEQAGDADADKARQKAGQRLGQLQARLAAQGTDLSGSPLDLLGDAAAAGAGDALSLRYDGLRNAWENRVRGAGRQAQARYYETAAGNVDPTLGIVKTLLS